MGKKGEKWDDFIARMPEKETRFGIFDFIYTNKDQMNISKLLFIHWLPDNAPIKNKVIYATGKENLKKVFGNLKEFTVTSKNDITEKDVMKELDKWVW